MDITVNKGSASKDGTVQKYSVSLVDSFLLELTVYKIYELSDLAAMMLEKADLAMAAKPVLNISREKTSMTLILSNAQGGLAHAEQVIKAVFVTALARHIGGMTIPRPPAA